MHIFDIQQNISTCVENSATLNEEVSPSPRQIASLSTIFPDYQKNFYLPLVECGCLVQILH